MARSRAARTADQGELFGAKAKSAEATAAPKAKAKPGAKAKPKARSTAKAKARIADKALAAAEPEAAPEPLEAARADRPARGRKAKAPKRRTAKDLAARQREISVSEFFTKNRHLLGFDSPGRALLTAVKEAVDNALDACEEAGIRPDLVIEIHEVAENRFRIAVEDNGPGIVRQQVPRIFGKLLYGSKFHSMKQSRGQQGIGISAAGMYGQLTTGKPVVIRSRTGPKKPAHYFELVLDTAKNQPKILVDREEEWDGKAHGTRVEIELEGTYRRGSRSVDAYVALSAMANPHASIVYHPPKDAPIDFPRATDQMPVEPKEIKPHPYGVELGMLIKMMHGTKARQLSAALQQDFSRVSLKVAQEICEKAKLKPTMRPGRVGAAEAEALQKAIAQTRILAPPTSCVSPIGEELMLAGLVAGLEAQGQQAEFTTSATRSPAIYRGNPFQVEVALAWGGNLPGDELAVLNRFANRVPLQYQQSACAITKAVMTAGWRNYGLQQSKGALPSAPLVISVHIASVWVPFTSEAKEAIASYPEILKELRLALQECGRRLGRHIRKRRRLADEERKRSHIEMFIPIIGEALQEILALTDQDREVTVTELAGILERSRKVS
jgi:DNA topoisomerase VI subunit B